MFGAGALGRPRGMVRGRRREEGSGWGTHVRLWQIHVDIWQNQYNIVKLKNKIKNIYKKIKLHDISDKFRQSSTRGELTGWERPKENMDELMTVM